jgi:hypothetical protein
MERISSEWSSNDFMLIPIYYHSEYWNLTYGLYDSPLSQTVSSKVSRNVSGNLCVVFDYKFWLITSQSLLICLCYIFLFYVSVFRY